MKALRVSLMVLAAAALLASAVFGAYAVAKEGHAMHTGCFAASAKAASCPPGSFDFWSFHVTALRGFSTATIMSLILLAFAFAYLGLSADLLKRVRYLALMPHEVRESRIDRHSALRPIRHWLALHERRDPSAF